MRKEITQLHQFISSSSSENATSHLIFPFFQKLFTNKNITRESAASGADLYIEGRLVVELKTNEDDWLAGFYQGMHYQKKGLSFSAICVISHNFIGLWRVNNLPDEIIYLISQGDAKKPASEVGKINSNKTNKGLQNILLEKTLFLFDKNNTLYVENQLLEFEDRLKNLDVLRNQINPDNFLRKIGELKKYFNNPLDAIHTFYSMIPFWDITSRIPEARPSAQNILWINGQNGSKASDEFPIDPKYHKDFRNFVENHYIFTNELEGISVDYYFSRFDEALSEHDPEYVKQHGIFFTDINLSRLALWFIREKFGEKKLSEKYIVIDPAGGSGNLISSWRKNHLKFKIVSELNSDLLKTIELRLKNDPIQVQQGYSIIPKTKENKGLNFLDKSAEEYYSIIEKYLHDEGKSIDKPFAFLLNPPYKNTREEEKYREQTDSNYDVHPDLYDLIKLDAGKERYILFLAQILKLCKIQKNKSIYEDPIIFIFSPTSWLIPRAGFKVFREIFDKSFKFQSGFIVKSNEFFDVDGTWPVSFTIWKYKENKNHTNEVILSDYTQLKKNDLRINWDSDYKSINKEINKLLKKSKKIDLSKQRIEIRDIMPELLNNKGESFKSKMLNLYRSTSKEEKDRIRISGWPRDDDRHTRIKAPHGYVDGTYIGFMDDLTPVRTYKSNDSRFLVEQIKTVWFRLDTAVKDANKMKIFSGPPDNRGYCAYNLKSAQTTFLWFSIGKIILGNYPLWANQMEIWSPDFNNKKTKELLSLAFSFCLSENRCIETKFEEGNPERGAKEIFIGNPLCPLNPESFWSTTLEMEISNKNKESNQLISSIKRFYEYWNQNFTKGSIIENVGLKDESYFKYFNYPDFLSPYSGLLQIRKYAEINGKSDLINLSNEIKDNTKLVRESFLNMLINDFKYFD